MKVFFIYWSERINKNIFFQNLCIDLHSKKLIWDFHPSQTGGIAIKASLIPEVMFIKKKYSWILTLDFLVLEKN